MSVSRNILYLLFFLSGASGLMYESVWSQYLKLLLGHAAYAQALVLSIFMGGLALGAWTANRLLPRWPNLLLAFCLVEAVVGVCGLVFHNFFTGFLEFSHHRVFPVLESSFLIALYKWVAATLLILPQCILLGMSFPLMSNGLLRQFGGPPGRTISLLYFSNSIGAAIGVLCAGFVLIQSVGLPGTLLTAANINILVAIGTYLIAQRAIRTTSGQVLRPWVAKGLPASATAPVVPRTLIRVVIAATAASGFASFVYEIVWIRQLSLVLGTSTHAFELMLSAFIGGIAIGGLIISAYADRIQNPLHCTAWIQLLMAFAAASTLPLYHYSFDLMGFFIAALSPNESGYILFNLASHFIALLIMLPTTICAGMTLPLLSLHLARSCTGYSEKSIAIVYSANTLGALGAVYVTVFWGLPKLTAGYTLFAASLMDLAVGLMLLVYLSSSRRLAATCTSLGLMLGVGLPYAKADLNRATSEVFSDGFVEGQNAGKEILFYRDGPTLSTAVVGYYHDDMKVHALTNNGKFDASLLMNNGHSVAPDEITMFMLGYLPILHMPDAHRMAVIGMGSGMTTHTILAAGQTVRQVDTVEIEDAVVDAAQHFLPHNRLAYDDPRSQIHIADAKTFFSNHQKEYDIIVSEPSNPWFAGAASLFTTEFYRQIKQHIQSDGMLVQWVHLYELTPYLFATIVNTLAEEFPYAKFYTFESDMIILASPRPLPIHPDPDQLFDQIPEALQTLYTKIGVNSHHDIQQYFIGTQELFYPWAKYRSQSSNSDYFPVLERNAVQARFQREAVTSALRWRKVWMPVVAWMYPNLSSQDDLQTAADDHLNTAKLSQHSVLDGSFRELQVRTLMAENTLLALGDENEPASRKDFEFSNYQPLRIALQEVDCTQYWQEATTQHLVRKTLLRVLFNTLRYASAEAQRGFIDLLRNSCTMEVLPIHVQWYKSLVEGNTAVIQQVAWQLYERVLHDDTADMEKSAILETAFIAAFINKDYDESLRAEQLYRTINGQTPDWMDFILGNIKQIQHPQTQK